MKDHFDKTFWYICGTSFIILCYVMMITFFPIPEKNQRFVDIALAFLLGFISANASYLTGGNPNAPKRPVESTGTTTADISISSTTTPTPQKEGESHNE